MDKIMTISLKFFKILMIICIPITAIGSINGQDPKIKQDNQPKIEKIVPTNVSALYQSFSPVVKKTLPAVVSISALQLIDSKRVNSMFMQDPFFFHHFFGSGNLFGRSAQPEYSRGSGVIIDPAGLVVTCFHVIDNAKDINVRLNDGREFEAQILASDERNDLALLKIKDFDKPESINFLPLGDPNALEIGDIVLAIGNPFGIGESITQGIVSALRRIVENKAHIQTDAAINPGNSGGPLVNMQGEVVGICRIILSKSGASHSVGFAVPSDRIRSLLFSYRNGVAPERPWTGLHMQTITNDMSDALGYKHLKGAIITQIHEKSPLAAGVLKKGDVITAVGHYNILSDVEFKAHFDGFLVGDTVALKVVRPTPNASKNPLEPFEVSFQLKSMPKELEEQVIPLEGDHIFDGARVAKISPFILERYELSEGNSKGIVIVDIKKDSSAQKVGLQKGDVIVSFNGQSIQTIDDLTLSLSKAPKGKFAVELARSGQLITMRVNM